MVPSAVLGLAGSALPMRAPWLSILLSLHIQVRGNADALQPKLVQANASSYLTPAPLSCILS